MLNHKKVEQKLIEYQNSTDTPMFSELLNQLGMS